MTRHPRKFLLYCLTAVVPVAGLIVAGTVAASAHTSPAAASKSPASSSSATAEALAKAAIQKLAVGQHPLNQKVAGYSKPGNVKGLTDVQSTNWSGYADTGSSFSAVSANWTEPDATCGTDDELAAFWVGIDGYSSSSVEQDGTIIECYQGAAYHYTWWEMYPTNDIQVVGDTIAAGDAISSSVTASGTNYTLSVTDSTNPANSFSVTESCTGCANSSAEWIAEAPSGASSIYPLANFGSWTASNANATQGATAGTISSFTDDQITMADAAGTIQAQPGPLNAAGDGFTVNWESAT